ncbi:MAG: hypothetical protein NC299_09895 [Lachnospiraceae bacterium]|nr:hypothetical protein [Ruminococcus sp.]MCM1275665.1 hypothetical protein [Lachnospiraceae bacterium]
MKELNPILYSLNDIDARYLAEPKRKRRPIAVIIAAAAAVSVLAFTGFVQERNAVLFAPTERSNIQKDVDYNKILYFEADLWDIDIPEKYSDLNGIYRAYDMLPSEVFAEFGLTMLTSDKFTEEIDYEPIDQGSYIERGQPYILYFSERGYGYDIVFSYNLYDTNIDKLVSIDAYYPMGDAFDMGIGGYADNGYEILTLKDGSNCYVDDTCALFTHDGVFYWLEVNNSGGYEVGDARPAAWIKWHKQILRDLGVL